MWERYAYRLDESGVLEPCMSMLHLKWMGIIGGEVECDECLVIREKHKAICQPVSPFSLTDSESFGLSRVSLF